jgi:hypothetical protein
MTTTRGPFEALDDYQTGEMSDAEALGFEDELFAAAAQGGSPEAAFVDQLVRLGRYLDGHCGFDIGSTKAQVDALIAQGLRVQMLAGSPDDMVGSAFRLPRIEDDAQIVVTHLPLDVRGYDSVDVVVAKPDGTELKRFREVGWDPDDGSMYAVCEAPLARLASAVGHLRSTVLGKRAGQEHVIAVFETVVAT